MIYITHIIVITARHIVVCNRIVPSQLYGFGSVCIVCIHIGLLLNTCLQFPLRPTE